MLEDNLFGIPLIEFNEPLISLEKDSIKNFAKPIIAKYNTDYFITQKDLGYPKSKGLCILTSMYNIWTYLFDYSVDNLKGVIDDLKSNYNRVLPIIKYFNDVYQPNLLVRNQNRKKLNTKESCVLLTQTDDLQNHAVACLGINNSYVSYFENGYNETLALSVINNLFWTIEHRYRKGIILPEDKYNFPLYFENRDKYKDSEINSKEFLQMVYDAFFPYIGYKEGVISIIERKYIEKIPTINTITIDKRLTKKTFNFAELIERLNAINCCNS